MVKFITLPKEKTEKIPKTTGIYALKSGRAILYIGKASNLRDRIKSHFQKDTFRDNLFIDQVSRIGYVETKSDIDALLLESHLIKQHQPKYNVVWRDDKKYFYVAITKDKLPRVLITHQPIQAQLIGPFVDGKALKQVLRLLRKAFPYYTAKKHPSNRCSWCHINRCPGPEPDATKYKKDLKNLKAVLEGKRVSVLKKLKKDMETASKQKSFEEAANLRDQYFALQRIVEHASLHTPSEASTIRGRVEGYDISNIQGKHATGSMVVFIDGKPATDYYRKFKIHIAGKPDDFAMMQELITRRLNHPEWPYPDLMIIDGGKGQLSSALKAMLEVRLPTSIKVVAIAKKHNELFLPKRSNPILLSTMPRETQNLILHVRDESHRFAINYHRKLRSIDLTQSN
ncbi:GIY-YIG nuclease family protein [Patescibacteria group bacterium]|nr:GIY-YIG nuclease family protein [Patescibacteria group bacterium]